MSNIVDFYLGKSIENLKFLYTNTYTGWTHLCLHLNDLQSSCDDYFLESCHNYIQWMFPLNEPSQFNSEAPILSDEDIKEFRNSFILKYNLYNSFLRMMKFLLLKTNHNLLGTVEPMFYHNWEPHWLTPKNHNLLRITRVLKSLSLLGLEDVARNFLKSLEKIKNQYNDIITDETWTYWENAVK